MLRRLTCLTLAVAAVAAAQPVTTPSVSGTDKKKLDDSGVVVRELPPTNNRGVSAVTMGVVDAPPDEVWPVIRDCEHFSKFLPSTKASARKEENGETICFDEIALPFPLTNLWADTKSVVKTEPAGHYQRSWTLVRGTYTRNQGSWTIVPWGPDGSRSLVAYHIDSDPSMAVPDFILRSAQTGSLPKVISGLRQRVLDLRARRAAGQ